MKSYKDYFQEISDNLQKTGKFKDLFNCVSGDKEIRDNCEDTRLEGKKECDLFINTKWDSTCTFLHQAVVKSQRDIIRALLQEGADPSVECLSVNTDAGLEENALQSAIRLDKVSDVDPLHGISHVFEEMFFQATALSR